MSTQNFPFSLRPMTYSLKLQIVKHMRLVPLNTAWGYAARDFVDNMEEKTDRDYEELLQEISADIQDGPGTMADVLGSTYNFFHRLIL